LGMDQGLSSNFAWSISQDKYGFMWIGTTNGLNRYDGHSIKQYLHDAKDSFSIPGNVIYWLFKDRDGDLWLACGHQGMVKYNYVTDKFEKLPVYEAARKGTRYGAPVWRIYEDLQGRIYFACGGALLRYTKSTKAIEDLTPLFNGGIDNDGVAMMIPQGKDKMWILTDGGIFFYDLVKNKIQKIPFDKEKYGYGMASMHDGEFINSEEILISMARPGFVVFNTRTGQFRPPPLPFDPSGSKKYNEIGGVLKDSKGRIWLANSMYGLVEYKPANNSVYLLKSEPSYPYPYVEQEGKGMNVFEDRDGNIWYGTSQRGVVWFQPRQDFIKIYQRDYSNPASLADDGIHGFLQLNKEEMLVGTGKGLTRLAKSSGRFFNYPYSVTASGNYPAAAVRSLTAHGDTVIMATDFGLSFYNKKTAAFKRIIAKDERQLQPFELFTNSLAKVYYTKPGELLLMEFNGSAARYDIKSGHCYYKGNSDGGDSLFSFSDIHSSAHDTVRKKLWVESGGGELHEYDLLSKKSTRHFYSTDTLIKTITAMTVNNKGELWLATNDGLYFYNPHTKKSLLYPLPTTTQVLLNVVTRDSETVWVTTTNEVVKLNANKGEAVSFNLNALLSHVTVSKRSLFIDDENNAWIGSNKGFCVLNEKAFQPQGGMSAPHLVNFKVFDQPKLFGRPYYELTNVELNYNENFFSFDFSALDYYQTAGLQYAYRLEGFDKDWKVSDKTSASYTNVPPGRYKLLLRTQYGLGKWKEAAPISVRIYAPFWLSWWFLTLLAIGLAACLYFIYRLRQKRRAEQRMDETVDYFANSLYGENSVNEICWDIARNCISQLKLEDCVVYLLDEKRNVLVQKAAYGPKNPKEHEIINPMDIDWGEGIVGTAAATGKSIIIKDTSKDSRYIVDDEQRLSELAVPIIHEGKAIGVIDSEHSKKNFFGEEHVKVLSTIAAICANKIAEAKAEAAARESEMQLLEIKKLLAESQLMALRAQMNPHFVFNCLNSIQECIVTQKYGEASLYLNKFSKLFRSVLNNSGKVMVTLAEEIEVLDLYLTLEHMRFEKSFNYTIHTDEELEADEILIPSMLLQPYVENALWHGLMHKEGDRRLSISFDKKSDDIFECVIDDNGIGRKKALELKEEQSKTKRHVSKGMTISKDRIELLQKQGQHAALSIVDKYDHAEAAGTKVVVELSAFLQ
ncbi:MAG TPA: histidine kinase, partial [Flavisolibacter sp.]|nr:histidine kinase [Flavisolibacter sp.]